MEAEHRNQTPDGARLLSCYLEASEEDGLGRDSVMVCKVAGEEIQSISLRVAPDAMQRWAK